MDSEAYYGSALPALRWAEQCLLGIVGQYPAQETVDGVQPILYCKSRIKSPQSMIRKPFLARLGDGQRHGAGKDA